MIDAYSLPSEGFVTLFPVANLGNDLAVALLKNGNKAGDPVGYAEGYALRITKQSPQGAKGHSVRLQTKTLRQARAQAAKAASDGAVLLCRAVATGKDTLWEKVETVGLMKAEQAAILGADLVGDKGVLIEKFIPTDIFDGGFIGQLASSVARKVIGTYGQNLTGVGDAVMASLPKGWVNLKDTPAKMDKILHLLHSNMSEIMEMSGRVSMPYWVETLAITSEAVVNGTSEYIADNFLPSIGTLLNAPEMETVNRIMNQQSIFIRDQLGKPSTSMMVGARKTIEEGLKAGLGRTEIGAQLQAKLPKMAMRYGKNYAGTVAANGIARTRAHTQLAQYKEAGIKYFEIVAMIDERTTDICRFLHGQIMNVEEAHGLSTAASNAGPEDIYSTSPFLEMRSDAQGQAIGIKDGGPTVASITRSGVGKVDDTGEFKAKLAGAQLQTQRVGAPPYHHRCRTRIRARIEMVTVPNGYIAQAQPAPAKVAPVKAKKPKPSAPLAVPKKKIPLKPPGKGTADAIVNGKIKPKPAKPARKPAKNLAAKPKTKPAPKPVQSPPKISPAPSSKKPLMTGGPPPEIKKKPKKVVTQEQRDDRNAKRRAQRAARRGKPEAKPKKGLAKIGRPKITEKEWDANDRKWSKVTEGSSDYSGSYDVAGRIGDDPDFDELVLRSKGGMSRLKCNKLSDMQKLDHKADFVQEMNSHWGATSRDEDKWMNAMQQATYDEFGLGKAGANINHLDKDLIRRFSGEEMKGFRKLAREQYNYTQEYLKGKGLKKITLMRATNREMYKVKNTGVDYTQGRPTKQLQRGVRQQPLNSWTTAESTADEFSSYNDNETSQVFYGEVPTERIYSLGPTGPGTNHEAEFVILGAEEDCEVLAWNRFKVELDDRRIKDGLVGTKVGGGEL